MSYRVIEPFSDKEDGFHVYAVGDEFPRSGIQVGKRRIEVLSGENNGLGKPVIQEIVVEQTKEQKPRKTKKSE